jgi:hypothetical protein
MFRTLRLGRLLGAAEYIWYKQPSIYKKYSNILVVLAAVSLLARVANSFICCRTVSIYRNNDEIAFHYFRFTSRRYIWRDDAHISDGLLLLWHGLLLVWHESRLLLACCCCGRQQVAGYLHLLMNVSRFDLYVRIRIDLPSSWNKNTMVFVLISLLRILVC